MVAARCILLVIIYIYNFWIHFYIKFIINNINNATIHTQHIYIHLHNSFVEKINVKELWKRDYDRAQLRILSIISKLRKWNAKFTEIATTLSREIHIESVVELKPTVVKAGV